MTCKSITCILLLALLCFKNTSGQDLPPDRYVVLNGREYVRYALTINSGHAYFLVDSLLDGSVSYDGVNIGGLKLMYDESLDELVAHDISKIYMVQLVKQKVDSFSIDGHRFVQLRRDASFISQPDPGFYEVLHEGRLVALKKEIKRIAEKTGTGSFERSFETRSAYYILDGKRYYQVNNQRDLIAVLGNKKELRLYIRENNLSYKRNPDELVASVIAYAETLILN
jgi:hypothetical protein